MSLCHVILRLLNRVREAERNTGVSINLELSNLKQWLIDVQNKLKSENTGYDGLFIVWDEFTELMRSAVGLRLLTPLQEITEALMSSENNSYFLFITHPSAFNGLIAEEQLKRKVAIIIHTIIWRLYLLLKIMSVNLRL